MSAVLPLPAAKRRSNGFLARLWRDKPLGTVGGIVLLLFLVVGVAVMLINLMVDLSYGFLDPKVRMR